MSEQPCGRGKFIIKRVYTDDKEGNPSVSRKGDPMVCLYIEVRDENGRKGLVREYIIEREGLTFLDVKRKSLFGACDRAELCVHGSNDNVERLEGLSGECLIKLEEYQGKMQPKIDKYYAVKKAAKQKEVITDYSQFDDSIPF